MTGNALYNLIRRPETYLTTTSKQEFRISTLEVYFFIRKESTITTSQPDGLVTKNAKSFNLQVATTRSTITVWHSDKQRELFWVILTFLIKHYCFKVCYVSVMLVFGVNIIFHFKCHFGIFHAYSLDKDKKTQLHLYSDHEYVIQ